ncbi:MAG: MFS transporter [Bifidobacteriaceae bacterium]|jgi:MFS family permease|nr:MFS transporter [Bifidobacteriaceae bacterium]
MDWISRMDAMAASDPEASVPPHPRNFRLLVAGQIVTVLGSALLRFALSLHVLDTTGRADLFAALFAISSVPVLLAPVGGAISDRFNRQRLMVLYDIICAGVTIVFLFIMVAGHASVLAVGAVMVALGVVGAMETPNGTACIPLLVERSKLESASGIVQAVQSLSGMAAPVLGGVLYAVLGIQALVALSGAAFAMAAVTEMFIRIPFTRRPRVGGMVRTLAGDLAEGFVYVWNTPSVRKLTVIAALLNLVLVPCFLVASPLILRMTLGSGDAAYGAGMGLIEAASIVGALTVGVFSTRMRISTIWRWILAAAVLFVLLALCVTPVGLSLGFWAPYAGFMACLMVMVAGTTILSIFVIVRIQTRTPGEHLGKVMAIIQAMAQCVAPVGQLLYGVAFQGFSNATYLPLLIAGGFTVLIALFARTTLRMESI